MVAPERAGSSDGDNGSSTLDRALEALSHTYRRRILTQLSDHPPGGDDVLSLDDLVREADDDDQLWVELYHVHLPKLDENGYVDWDRDDDAIRRGPNFDAIAPLIRLFFDHQHVLPGEWP